MSLFSGAGGLDLGVEAAGYSVVYAVESDPVAVAPRSCGKEVYDLKHERTGKLAPIEVELTPSGNVIADLVQGTYRTGKP